jgi:hypothetical protein
MTFHSILFAGVSDSTQKETSHAPPEEDTTAVIVDIAWAALAASAAAVFVDISRYAQWKREYRSEIARLCAAAYPR